MGLTAVLSRALVVFLFNADLRTSRKPHQAENVTDPHCVWAQAALAEEGSQPAGSLLPGQCPSAHPHQEHSQSRRALHLEARCAHQGQWQVTGEQVPLGRLCPCLAEPQRKDGGSSPTSTDDSPQELRGQNLWCHQRGH